MASDPGIIAFCHINKVGGTTLTSLLRRHFGVRHMDLGRRRLRARTFESTTRQVEAYVYGPSDLRGDLRFYPGVRSISGHMLRPFVDFEEFAPRLRWYTFLRPALERFRSHYLHQVELRGQRLDLPTMLREYALDDFMTRKIAGSPDLASAKRLLSERMRFVGLQSRFDESLLLMRQRLGLAGFRLRYPKPLNTASARAPSAEQEATRKWAVEQLELHADLVLERNQNDLALHAFAEQEIWPRQVAEYGGAERLARDAEQEVGRGPHTPRERFRMAQCQLYRRLVVDNYHRLELALHGRRREQR